MGANVVKIKTENFSTLEKGKILSSEKGLFEVLVSGVRIWAEKSFGCIVEPVEEDIVLLAFIEDEKPYILNILERRKKDQSMMEFDSDLIIKAKNLTFSSSEDTNMISRQRNMLSDSSFEKTDNAVIKTENISMSSKTANLSFLRFTLVSDFMNSIVKNMIGRFKSYTRKTESSDMVSASTMDRKSEGLYSLHSEYSIMISKKDTKIDGEHIHMG